MPFVCSRDGHLLDSPEGQYCPEHGSRVFEKCPTCDAHWSVIRGAHFCTNCAHPAPWVSRDERIRWLRDRVSDYHKDPAEVVKLQAMLDKLAQMDPDDANTLVGWDQLKKAVPKLLEVAGPILESVMSASIRAKLGLP